MTILLAFEVDGEKYPPALINDQNRLVGSGPFRLVAPQMKNPGIPDISSRATAECLAKIPEKYRLNPDYEKNSDYCVKAVVAIRVHPLPSDMMDIHWQQYANKPVGGKNLVIFGALNPAAR